MSGGGDQDLLIALLGLLRVGGDGDARAEFSDVTVVATAQLKVGLVVERARGGGRLDGDLIRGQAPENLVDVRVTRDPDCVELDLHTFLVVVGQMRGRGDCFVEKMHGNLRLCETLRWI